MDEVTKIKINHASMSEKLDNLCTKVDKIDTKLDNLDKKYAGRWVELVAVGALIGILAQLFINGQ